ncbi:MAG: hypothetical protein ACF8NJ_08595, partial [Phycisphaerales bacterium JB038]
MRLTRGTAAGPALAGLVWALAGSSAADTLQVPGEYATIQEAIDAATTGDIVELADGTHLGEGNREIDFRGKAVTLRSASGDPGQCIINCEQAGVALRIYQGEGADTVVEGLTIINAFGDSASKGAALYCAQSTPTIRNCIFMGNQSLGEG